jgi:hypothetical protein
MNGTATQQFSVYRIHSVTRPTVGVGLLQGFGTHSRQDLEALTAEDLNFYVDEFLMKSRGDERHTEQFILQGSNSLDGPWEDIKPIVPLLGDDPRDLLDEEDDDRWGQCMRCNRNLTESEAALNDTCEGCRPVVYEEWEANQERLAEETAEARRYPEVSDDDDDEGCPHCGSYGCNTWDCQQ